MGSEKCKYNWQGTGRMAFYDSSTFETHMTSFPVEFYDDFIGADTVIPAGGSEESGCHWSKAIVLTAGTPTVAKVADAAGGLVQCALDATSEAQTASLYMGDQRNFDVSKGLIFEARVKVSVTPTDVAEAVWGIMADTGVPDTVAYSAFFTADGSTSVYCETDDNATDTSADSGITAGTTDWRIYRIDCTDVTDIRFYIDGAQVASSTTFPYAATGANAILQPWIGLYKASGTGVGTLQVDYVKLMQNRS